MEPCESEQIDFAGRYETTSQERQIILKGEVWIRRQPCKKRVYTRLVRGDGPETVERTVFGYPTKLYKFPLRFLICVNI